MASGSTQRIAIEIAGRVASSLGNSINSASNKLESLGKAAVGAAKVIGSAFATVQVGDFLKESIDLYSEFEQKMADMQAQTGLTDKEMQTLEQSSKNLFKNNYGESISDIADSMAAVRQQTKLSGNELEDFTKNALVLADTFGMEVPESTRAAQMMIQQFGYTGEEAYNLIAQGAQQGLNKNNNLLDSINEYSVHFKKVGLDGEAMFNIFNNASKVGVFDLDKIGDAVKEFSIRAIDGSKSTNEAYQALGLNADDMAERFAKGGDTASQAFEETIKAIQAVKDPVKQDAIGVALWGTLWEDMGKQAIFALGSTQDEITKTKDAMGEIDKQKYGTLKGSLGILGRQFETFRINAIEKISPYLTQGINFIIDTLPKIPNAIKNVIDIAKSYIEPYIPYIINISNSIQEIIGNCINFITDTIIPTLKPAFDIVVQVVSQVVQRAVPFIAKLVESIGGIVRVVLQIASSLIAKLQPVFNSVFSFISGTLVPQLMAAFDLIAPKVIEIMNKVVPCVQAIWTFISPIISAIVSAIQTALPIIFNIVSGVVSSITTIIGTLMSVISGIIDFVTNVFTGNWSAAWGNVVDIFGTVFNGILDLAKKPINTIIGYINGVISKINGISVDVPDWVPEIGGKSFGVSIPKIPQLAAGGIATKSTIAEIGEGKEPEAVTPISKLADFMNGYVQPQQQSQPITYSPQIIIQGNARKEDIHEALSISQREFNSMMQKWLYNNKRVAF